MKIEAEQFEQSLKQVPKDMACPSCGVELQIKEWVTANPKAAAVIELIMAIVDVCSVPEMTPYVLKLLPELGAEIMAKAPDASDRVSNALQKLLTQVNVLDAFTEDSDQHA